MKIGIYVGSFNPVHLGHIDTANKLIENNYVDKVYIVPTLGYWNKHNLAPLKNRIEMLKLVSNNNIIIDDTNNKLEFTYQIMDKYHTLMPDDEIRLIIGADNLLDFKKWKNYEKLLNYGVIVVKRDNYDISDYNFYNVTKALINPIQISSTEIRNNNEIRRKYLNPKVLKYIYDNKLY